MFDRSTPAFLLDPATAGRVLNLIFARLALIILIVLGEWWFGSDTVTFAAVPSGAGMLLAATVLLAALYLSWLKLGKTLLWQIRTQFLLDTLLITWLVYLTGVLISPYVTLYIVIIGLAGFFLGKTDALVIAGAACVCFTALPLLADQQIINPGSGELTFSVQTVAFNDAAFLFVGLLAARLADRRKIGEALRRAEANFADLRVLHERILASVNSGLITTDLDARIHAVNRAAEEILGIKARDMIGDSIFSIFGDAIRPPVELFDGRTHQADLAMFQTRIERPEGMQPVTVSYTVQALTASTGETTGLIVAFNDTTKVRAMEDSLRRSDRLAAIGRLAAGLAHEIRNPLGSMTSAIQFLAEKAGRDRGDAELMDVVVRESDRLNRIIADFLAYARPGNQPHDRSNLDLGAAISDCLSLLRHDPVVTDSHTFDFQPPGRRVMMRADETQIKQIFWNLFQNSIKAMPGGGRLSVDLGEANGAGVKVVVSDTGCGISSERIGQIFEPFHSGSNGTGLGLAVVHRIVTEGGGDIGVESKEGVGTSVVLTLPKKMTP